MLNGVSGTHNKSVAHIDVTSPVEASFAARPNRLFKFHKRGQLFIGVHNKAFSVVAMRVGNPDGSPVRNQRLRRTPNSNWIC